MSDYRGNRGKGRGRGRGNQQGGRGGPGQGAWGNQNEPQGAWGNQNEPQGAWGNQRGGQNRGHGRGGPNQQQGGGRGGPNQQQGGGRGGPNQQRGGGRGGPRQPQDAGRGAPNPPQGAWGGRGGPQDQGAWGQAQNRPPPPGAGANQRPAGPGQVVREVEQMKIGDSNTASRARIRGRQDCVKTIPDSFSTKVGTDGRRVNLIANFVPVDVSFKEKLFQYTVTKEPEEMDTYTAKKIMDKNWEKIGTKYLFDGSSLYTISELQIKKLTGTHQNQAGNDFEYTLTLKKNANQTVLYSKEFYQILNTLFRRAQGLLQMRQIGKNYFDVQNPVIKQIDRIETDFRVYQGMISSIRCHEGGRFLLNIDPIIKVTRNQNVLEMVQHRMLKGWESVEGKVVMTPYSQHRTYFVKQVLFNERVTSKFMRDGKEVSYADYNRERYGLRVTDVNQPLLLCKPRGKLRISQDCHLIPEFCILTGITQEERKDFRVSQALLSTTSQDPKTKLDKFRAMLNRLRSSPEVRKELTQWKCNFGTEPEKVAGRVLAAPKFDDSKNIQYVGKGTRLASLPDKFKMIVCANRRHLSSVVNNLKKAAQTANVPWPEAVQYELNYDRNSHTKSGWCDIKDIKQYDMVVVVSDQPDYFSAKKHCTENGVASQFINERSLFKQGFEYQMCPKIVLQILCKVGADAWTLSEGLPKNTMIVGYDCCHEGPETKGTSFGAAVCSYNKQFSQYYSNTRSFRDMVEISDHLSDSVESGVEFYKKKNGMYPDRVMVFRDGVGEGQLDHVYTVETKEIRRMLDKKAPNINLVFTIVTKRINSKFFLSSGNGVRNPNAGTVVDTTVTLPERYDFFLISQDVRRGTVNPTSYNVIHDDFGVTPDRMQKLAYHLSYMYYNWAGPVTVPSPCMYAHKLAAVAGNIGEINPENLAGKLWFL